MGQRSSPLYGSTLLLTTRLPAVASTVTCVERAAKGPLDRKVVRQRNIRQLALGPGAVSSGPVR